MQWEVHGERNSTGTDADVEELLVQKGTQALFRFGLMGGGVPSFTEPLAGYRSE